MDAPPGKLQRSPWKLRHLRKRRPGNGMEETVAAAAGPSDNPVKPDVDKHDGDEAD